MSKMMRLSVLAGAAAALLWSVAPQPIAAQDAKAVKERQELMKSNSANVKAIAAFVKGGKGSAADVEQRLMRIASTADKIPDLFPKGTDVGALGPKATGAKMEIWSKADDFEKAAENLKTQAQKFAAVVKSGDKAMIGSTFGDFGKNACGTCHRTFRAKRQK